MELLSLITRHPVMAGAVFLSLILIVSFLMLHARSREDRKKFLDQTFEEPCDLRKLGEVRYVIVHQVMGDKMLVQRVYCPKHHPCVLYHEGMKRFVNASHIQKPLPAEIRQVQMVSLIGKQFWALREAVIPADVHARDLLMVGTDTIARVNQTKEFVWEGNLRSSLS